MNCTIYKITNLINGKVYVGQTWQPMLTRWRGHQRHPGCTALHAAIKKYGAQRFSVSSITVAHTQEVADHWEAHFIRVFDSIKKGYNLKEGGAHGQLSLESRLRRSVAMMGNTRCVGHKQTPEVRANLSVARRGKGRPSEELRARLSVLRTGVPLSEAHKESIRTAQIGRKHSAKTLAKMSSSQRGRTISADHKAKLSLANLGKTLSDKTKQKISASLKACSSTKGRFVAGGHGKLMEVSVLEMRVRYSNGESFAALGRAFGVSQQSARSACLGLTYTHVKTPHDPRGRRGGRGLHPV